MKRTILILAAIFFALSAAAQTELPGLMKMDRSVHDFGEIAIQDGPVSCSFTLTNTSEAPFEILSVVSSCGCTGVKWTRKTLSPGESGRIDATYSNDEGPGTFDKRLTVYLSAIKRPVILHIKGTAVDRKKNSFE